MLEKQLLHMDLSKGMDERARPELIDSASGLTTVENLVQDQTGAWVKRPGMRYLDGATALDSHGNSMTKCRALLGTHDDGLATVCNGKLYAYLEETASWKNQGLTSEVSLKSWFVTSSGISGSQNDCGFRIISSASSTKYDAVVIQGSPDASGVIRSQLVIYERASGTTVMKYSLFTGGATAASIINARIAFVADRYLHVWWHDSTAAGTFSWAQIDTDSDMPTLSTFMASSVGVGTFGAVGAIYDIAVTDDRSIVVMGVDGMAWATTGGVTGVQAVSHDPRSCSCDEQGLIWCSGTGAAARVQITAYTASDLTLAPTYDWQDATVTATTNDALVALPDGSIYLTQTVASGTATMADNGSTYPEIGLFTTSGPADTSLNAEFGYGAGATYWLGGWYCFSRPFYCKETAKVYLHVAKRTYTRPPSYTSIPEIGQHAVICLSDYRLVYSNITGTNPSHVSVRPAVNLEGYNAFVPGAITSLGAPSASGPHIQQRYLQVRDNEHVAWLPIQISATSAGFAACQMRFNTSLGYNSAAIGHEDFLPAGCMQVYDGYRSREVNFLDRPLLGTGTVGGVGSVGNGTFLYVAVYRGIGRDGAVAYSRTSNVVSVTTGAANKTVTIKAYLCNVTWRNGDVGEDGMQVSVDVYRTTAGGTTYYLVGSTRIGGVRSQSMTSALGVATLVDSWSDTTLTQNGIPMYRQPGTVGTALDRVPPPGNSDVMCVHKDRLFSTDPYGQRVYYSSFFVDGEEPWFNAQFSFYLHGGSGPITGLASMDGRLFVFRRDAIFVVDGDGPPENGGSGAEFTVPSRIATGVGTIDPRSIVVTPIGIAFISHKGPMMLTRGLELKWIGERVQTTFDAYPVCTAAVMDGNQRVYFAVTTSEPEAQGSVYHNDGRVLVYDIPSDCWSVWKLYSGQGEGTAIQGLAIYRQGTTERLAACDPDLDFTWFDDAIGYDRVASAAAYRKAKLETGWIKMGTQARQRIYDFLALVRRSAADAALKVSVAYNWSDTYTQDFTWEPSASVADVGEYNLNPSKQDVKCLRIKIEDQSPADTGTYPLDTCRGFDILGLTFKVGMKPYQSPTLPSGQKG